MKPQVPMTVAIGVATRDLKANEVVMQGDVIVQGYAQVMTDAPRHLVAQWRREARRRRVAKWLRIITSPLASLRVPLIHLLGGLDVAEAVREEESE